MKLRISTVFILAFLASPFWAKPQSVIAQDWSTPQDIPGEVYYAAFPLTVTLDGQFDDWASVRRVQVSSGPLVPEASDAQTTFWFAAAADGDNLYFKIDVVDPHIIAGQHGINYWNEDSVELYLNATGNLALTDYAAGVAQITIPAVNIGKGLDQLVLYGKNWEGIGVRALVVQTDTGYAMEVAVPLHNAVWNIDPSAGQALGFQIQLNGASQQDRDLKLSWSKTDTNDQSYINPSVFGRIIFSPVTSSESAPENTSAAISPTLSPTGTAAQGEFTTQAHTIYAPDGSEFVAKGTNVSGFNWVWPRRTVDDLHLIVDCWAFNLVRVNSFLFMGETRYQQYTTNNDLDEIVRKFTERGVVVVFEGHDRIGSYYQGNDLRTLIAWYTDLARKYRDNPYVWFDVMNEPGGRRSIDVDQWVNMHGQVIQAIRDTGANNIIIVEGAYGGQDSGNNDSAPVVDSAILRYGKNVLHYGGRTFDNIVFSIHTYDLWNHGDAKLADFFDRVHALGYPIIIGEYGIQTDQDTFPAAQSTFNTVISRKIGRIVWHWDGSDANDLTVNTSSGGGWEINDCTNPTNLSWLGQQVWNDNHSGSS